MLTDRLVSRCQSGQLASWPVGQLASSALIEIYISIEDPECLMNA